MAAAAVAACLIAAPVSAQTFPSKPIRIVVAFTAGGGSDLAARVVGQKLSERVGQPVVIENRPGANGAIGAEQVVKAPADGYTLVMGSAANISTNQHLMKLAYDPMKDLVPVSMLSMNPMLLFVNPSVAPVNNVRELVALARARNGKLDYASGGGGSPAHLGMELLNILAGVSMVHIPYKGGTPGVQDVVAGQVGVMMAAAPTVQQFIRAGKVRGLATTGAKRSAFMPDLPSIAESGFPDYDVTIWNAVFAPSGTPQAVQEKLNAEMNAAIAQQDVRDMLFKSGAEITAMSLPELRRFMQVEYDRWARVIREAKIKME